MLFSYFIYHELKRQLILLFQYFNGICMFNLWYFEEFKITLYHTYKDYFKHILEYVLFQYHCPNFQFKNSKKKRFFRVLGRHKQRIKLPSPICLIPHIFFVRNLVPGIKNQVSSTIFDYYSQSFRALFLAIKGPLTKKKLSNIQILNFGARLKFQKLKRKICFIR